MARTPIHPGERLAEELKELSISAAELARQIGCDCGRRRSQFPFFAPARDYSRKTIDLLIGTWCVENRASLLHNDSDFHPVTRYLGLREFTGRER